MTNAGGPTLAEVNEQIELLRVVQRFGAEVQEFADWMANLSGGNVRP